MSVSTDIKRHAAKEYPNECCGLVVDGKYFPAENTAEEPAKAFRISAEFFAACEDQGKIEAIVHSHPDHSAAPSQTDKHISELLGIPYWIQSVREGKCDGRLVKYVPNGWKVPLIGREFVHGVFDCLSIVLDYYKRERGIDLGTYHREDGWWDIPGKDYYRELLPKAGFRQVETPQDGDVILMQIRAKVPNHAAVFLEHGKLASEPEHYPAPGSILHHMYGRDSRRDPYGGQWAEKTVSIWRHGNT